MYATKWTKNEDKYWNVVHFIRLSDHSSARLQTAYLELETPCDSTNGYLIMNKLNRKQCCTKISHIRNFSLFCSAHIARGYHTKFCFKSDNRTDNATSYSMFIYKQSDSSLKTKTNPKLAREKRLKQEKFSVKCFRIVTPFAIHHFFLHRCIFSISFISQLATFKVTFVILMRKT